MQWRKKFAARWHRLCAFVLLSQVVVSVAGNYLLSRLELCVLQLFQTGVVGWQATDTVLVQISRETHAICGIIKDFPLQQCWCSNAESFWCGIHCGVAQTIGVGGRHLLHL